jgi:hypothetical protein
LSLVPPWETWQWPVPPGTTANTLADTIDRSTDDLLAAVAQVSEDTLGRPRRFDKWSARDVLAHCVAWSEVCARILHGLATDTIDVADYADLPVGEESGDELNERQVEDLQGVGTEVLLERLIAARDTAARSLRTLPGAAPAELVLLTFGDHLDEHASSFRELAAGDA